ncbi:UDP-3-O-(3-hydroxymyristoyl)glucosamine N-acyltransferase [Legionella anisa]|uniref:UDP-3-O-(3-hydroxymyristoyl)glucosamine N-acyltransferase n=1 Tax=Legionella anisa TaxID=28082 RepID=A0AAX0WQX8_9GAMM|nr:UDP-3-O-(3-hydroxymyristoyl)glucosamine N-acyltransferase [Legionella anisa]AWN75290.1 UDP-3-O-(3-hydroxymyristoyl)glucosamine N-acyltransferase [Legionella anisa]KTC72653.1 UDP-3-O-[3-hydroxymyristoyl] glucosamine N-acyltransferase [Legionella anisa]MBN5935470.1 UDP-3-O-(3-hydroxymyristoyl)glucosamine N-acyltransferase [Legionella anisa]MCW8424538.1 UDP-3-O-(3-hydroxymyristoyl)glucosamine N-acyltransferase [Legionella anisa]MCW8446344.1 UDP-3-O-(3-hydroxymyristoyl)glucosamine N-acyltransfe
MLTLAELAEHLGGVWHGNANHAIFCFASLSRATSKDVAYYDNSALRQALDTTSAGAVILKAKDHHLYEGNCIVVSNPLQAMMQAAQFLSVPVSPRSGVDSTAIIHQSAQLGQGVSIGAYSVIGANTQIADGVTIGANTVIESSVRIGQNSQIGHKVVIHAGCQLGAYVVINSGCIIGASPFNYLKEHGHWQQGYSVGAVIIANQVQIGANTVIDRGSLSDTYLGEGVCIDNLVQIAHDVLVGQNTVIAGCAALGAYAQIGADCIIGGASCIAAHVHLADDVVITGMSTVSKSLAKSGIYSSGTLVHEHRRWRRNVARFRRLDDYIVKLGALEKKLSHIE